MLLKNVIICILYSKKYSMQAILESCFTFMFAISPFCLHVYKFRTRLRDSRLACY